MPARVERIGTVIRAKPGPVDELPRRGPMPGGGIREVRTEAPMDPTSSRDGASQPAPAASKMRPTAGRGRGQSLVELALAVPILLLLMLGTIDIGRMFFDYIELRNAVREGAAYASRNPTDSAGARTRVTGHGNLVSSATVTGPTFGAGCFEPGGTGSVVISASQTFTPITTAFLSNWGLGSVNLSASATMRCLT